MQLVYEGHCQHICRVVDFVGIFVKNEGKFQFRRHQKER